MSHILRIQLTKPNLILITQPSFDSVHRDPDNCWILLRSGDKMGLEGLYQIFSRDLFRFGLSMIRDQDFVQDCIQEVFIDLWKYHKTLQPANNVKVYLFKSLSRKIAKESTKVKKWKTVEVKDSNTGNYCIESIESKIINEQIDRDLKEKLASGLENLPERQKEVILYLFFENFSYEQVSKMMGINLRSVYTLAWKAISSLKKSVFSIFLYIAGSIF
jgi:RNA polymerase sigma factor (sigma-70 family)